MGMNALGRGTLEQAGSSGDPSSLVFEETGTESRRGVAGESANIVNRQSVPYDTAVILVVFTR